MSAPAFVSRFHAIITAKSIDGTGPPVISTPSANGTTTYETWGSFQNKKKRRRMSNAEAGPSVVKKGPKRVSEDEGTSSREPTKVYESLEDLLVAMKERFKAGSNVDFHGTYETTNIEAAHKQSVQTIANDVWKATGYRFTVKDHPQVVNGHKTRFWCSQDEAHRSKSSREARKMQGDCYKPRTTSAGEVMAKTRYPCRSRLLISSRDSHLPATRSITIRMHHHHAHEPYVEANMTPEMIRRICEKFGWTEPPAQDAVMDPIPETGPGETRIQPPSFPDTNMEEEESSDGETEHLGNVFSAMNEDSRPEPEPRPLFINANQPLMTTPPSVNEEYRARMRAHIKNLREFANGLEYQLQFEDYRMLEVLEREGGSFLALVRDCLEKEGRLVPIPQPDQEPQSSSAAGSINLARNYQGNPGINPRALDY